MKTSASLLLTLCAVALFSACEKKPATPPPPPAPVVTTTKGILDHSRWNKWVQSPPRVILVSSLDEPTQKLIAAQARIFTTLVNPPPETNAPVAGDVQAQLDAVKNAFPATRQVTSVLPVYEAYPTYTGYANPTGTRTSAYRSSNYGPITVPQHERWDSFRRTVAHANLTNLPGIITQLERKIASDTRDLEYQLASRGAAGAQAHADTAWLRGPMTELVDRMKAVGKSNFVSPSAPAEVARQEWRQFEATDLPLIKQVIDANTLAEATVNPDGTFSIEGRGTPVAVITVAGRQLYFTTRTPGALRFFNLDTATR